jgi:hypothetical protein
MSALLNPSVPVTLESSWGGLASNTGLLRLEGDTLVLEFETRDGVLDMLASGVKRYDLRLTDLEACQWHRGWFRGKIEISVRSMSVLEGIAGAAQGRVKFGVARKDRDRAFGLVATIELALAHRVVRAAEESGRL